MPFGVVHAFKAVHINHGELQVLLRPRVWQVLIERAAIQEPRQSVCPCGVLRPLQGRVPPHGVRHCPPSHFQQRPVLHAPVPHRGRLQAHRHHQRPRLSRPDRHVRHLLHTGGHQCRDGLRTRRVRRQVQRDHLVCHRAQHSGRSGQQRRGRVDHVFRKHPVRSGHPDRVPGFRTGQDRREIRFDRLCDERGGCFQRVLEGQVQVHQAADPLHHAGVGQDLPELFGLTALRVGLPGRVQHTAA